MTSKAFTLERGRTGTALRIKDLTGDPGFISRASGRGFTPGAGILVIRNHNWGPLIVFLRDTLIALGRSEAKKIVVTEVNS